MSAYSQKQESSNLRQPTRTDFAPGERPLYFNNRGLFSDPFLAFHLPELEKKASKDAGVKYLNKYWNEATYEGYNAFNHFYAQMLSMWDQYADLLPEYNEAQLEERWIKPILKLLGWAYEVQDGKTKRAKRNIPDYSLFSSEDDYIKAKKTNTDEAYFEHVLAVADAKAWKLALDGIGRTNNNPSYQIVRYMEHSGVAWSILTNGRFWRLYSTRSTSKHTTYYEIDLESLLTKRDDERFKYFYNFFRRDAFVKTSASQQCFLDVVFENGVYYAKEVEENLKQRVFEVVENIAKGFINDEAKLSTEKLKEAYDHSLYYLFRLMFILNCESKGLLAVDKTSDYYEYSLRKLITGLKAQFDGNHNWSSQSRTYGVISSLFDTLADGDARIGVHGFGKEVFSAGDARYYKNRKIADHHLNSALVQLACDYADNSDDLQFIDYKRLSEDHLGSLFEGLLEYSLRYAETKMAVTKKGKIEQWSDLTEKQRKSLVSSVIQVGDSYLASGQGERKSTGSYYTPSYVVDYLAKETLEPLIKGRKNSDILKMKFLDSAMGSAHFLIGVVKYLEGAMLENLNAGDDSVNESESAKIRWLILHNCILGVDINPLAVELAKFSLWMYTANREQQLEPLSDQLLCRNSLTSETFRNVDGIVGNPPYIRVHKQDAEMKRVLKKRFLSVEGDFDAYVLFLENALQQLKPDGRAGFIIPNKFLSRDYAGPARKNLKETASVEKIIDLGAATDIFDVAVYPAIIVYGNTLPSKKHSIATAVSPKSAREFLNSKIKWRELSQSSLNVEKWELPGDQFAGDVLEKLGELKPLSERYDFDLFCGTPRAKDYYEWSNFLASGKANGKSVVKYFVCRSIKPFELEWGPKISSLGTQVENATFKIDQADLSGQLRERFKKAPKILIRGNDYRLTACVDRDGSAFVGVYGLIPKNGAELSTILCWSNSTMGNLLFKRKNGAIGLSGGFFSINAPHIESLPTPVFPKEMTKRFEQIAEKSSNWPTRIAELDLLIANHFGITSDEMVHIYDSLGVKYADVRDLYLQLAKKKKAA